MAPILRRRDLLDEVEARVIRSVVIVKFFMRGSEVSVTGKRKRETQDTQLVARTHYRASTGFIVDSAKGTALVVVPSPRIDPKGGDIVRVFFHGGIIRDACVFISKTQHGHMVLEVKNCPAHCPAVTFHTQTYHRGDVFVLANRSDSGLNSYSGTVIHPDTTAYPALDGVRGFSKTKTPRSEEMFTFNLIDDSFVDTVGAAVFDMAGIVAGAISHEDTRSGGGCKITYARHACYFAPQLLENIQRQKGKLAAGK
ncbi:uncharacterized protein LOC124657969 [Lolium rigidum]|uniref:uncharacterized protein LOC124657969 n=1 Tax=Lolium rigidum TaxID=89674 RepID=UPI001F5D2191|nr:uncharacterized protein LOC124657969 [Lolium rigidum]